MVSEVCLHISDSLLGLQTPTRAVTISLGEPLPAQPGDIFTRGISEKATVLC
jgi:hypothetical protein